MTATLNEIIDRVQRLITLPPDDDILFNSDDFASFTNDCLMEKIYPRVMKTRDDYFLAREVFPLQGPLGNDLYPTGVMPIPPRAWGNTIRELKYIDSSGNYYKINPYYLENEELYQTRNLALSSQYQKGYMNYNSGIRLVPPPLQDTGSVVMYYIITPSTVIADDEDDNQKTAVSISTDILNMSFNSSTNIATYTTELVDEGTLLDLYCPLNESRLFDVFNKSTGMLLATSIPLTRRSSTSFNGPCTIQIGTDIISPNVTEMTNFQNGGFPVSLPYVAQLCLVPAGKTPYTPVMPMLDNLLVYELAIKILSAQGYVEELQTFLAEHADLRKDLISQIAMRVESEPYVISSTRGIRQSILYSNFRRRF